MSKNFTLMAAISLVALSGTLGCLKSKDASVKTLDNIETLGPLEFTECAGTYNLNPMATQLALPRHLLQAVQSVPEKLQQSFFEDLHGRIEVSSNLAGICWPDESHGPAREDEVLGCVRQYGNSDRPLVIHLLATTPAKEAYGLLLRFGFIMSNQVQNRNIPATGEVTFWGATGGASGQTNERIAIAFLADAGSRGTPAATALEKFGIPLNATLAATDDARENSWRSIAPEIRADLATRIIAEAFHSRYCTAETRKSMSARYPRTSQLFEMVAADLEGRALALASNSDVGKASSTWNGWYKTYDGATQSRRARGDDMGSKARTNLAQSIEAGLKGSDSEQSYRLMATNKMDIDMMQLLGFLFQALRGLSSGNSQIPQGFSGGLGGGNLLPGFLPPGNLPIGPMPMGPQPGGILPMSGSADAEAKSAFDSGNRYRQQSGLQPLQWSDTISTECNAQAQAQIAGGMNHWLVPHPNSNAENIASGQTTGSEVATAWYNSDGHRANLLGSYTQSAVGHSNNEWCQRFK